jgi:hypothetical protein
MARAEITGRKPCATAHAGGKTPPIRGPPEVHTAVDAFSIASFCKRHGISESFFHKLRVKGLGPVTMKVGSRTLISAEAAAEWRRAREGVGADEDVGAREGVGGGEAVGVGDTA